MCTTCPHREALRRCFLRLRYQVILQRPDAADLYLDGVAGEHVAVGALGAHPLHISWMEGGLAPQFNLYSLPGRGSFLFIRFQGSGR